MGSFGSLAAFATPQAVKPEKNGYLPNFQVVGVRVPRLSSVAASRLGRAGQQPRPQEESGQVVVAVVSVVGGEGPFSRLTAHCAQLKVDISDT